MRGRGTSSCHAAAPCDAPPCLPRPADLATPPRLGAADSRRRCRRSPPRAPCATTSRLDAWQRPRMRTERPWGAQAALGRADWPASWLCLGIEPAAWFRHGPHWAPNHGCNTRPPRDDTEMHSPGLFHATRRPGIGVRLARPALSSGASAGRVGSDSPRNPRIRGGGGSDRAFALRGHLRRLGVLAAGHGRGGGAI